MRLRDGATNRNRTPRLTRPEAVPSDSSLQVMPEVDWQVIAPELKQRFASIVGNGLIWLA